MDRRSDMPNSDADMGLHPCKALPPGLARAVGWLRERLDEPIHLDTLAAVAGVRPRALEVHFRRYLRTTPLGWVRRMRLARARQQLLATWVAKSVTGVAVANGFTELGRFAAQYRRQFGELPSQRLKAVRGKSHTADEFADKALRLSWHALASAFIVGPKSCSTALANAEHAQELAPQQALPKAIAGWCWSQRAAHNFGATPAARSRAGVAARRPGGTACAAGCARSEPVQWSVDRRGG